MSQLVLRNGELRSVYGFCHEQCFSSVGLNCALSCECKSVRLNGVHCKWEQDLATIFCCCLITVVWSKRHTYNGSRDAGGVEACYQ